jgi:hypothetical protein
MSMTWHYILRAVTRVDGALLRVRNSMTAGQRWTSALAMVVVIAVLAFGLPVSRVLWPGYAASAPTISAAPPVAPAPAPPAAVPGAVTPVSAPVPPAATATTIASTPVVAAAGGVPHVVVLTKPDPAPVDPRDDTAMANAELATAVFPWTALPDTGAVAQLCTRVTDSGSVVISAHALSLPLEDCLIGNGLTVVSPSPRGTRRAHAGLSVSVRRGDLSTIGDLAVWAAVTHLRAARIGLVLDESRRTDLQRAASVALRSGLHVVATAWLSTGSSVRDVLDATNQFAAARVNTVVFAIPVGVQRTWVTEATARHFSYVVSDVDDGVADEHYPPTFDGATAHTSLRIPWYSRDHTQTADQQYCASQWTSSQTAPVELPGEQMPVDTWCEEVALVNQAVSAAVLASGNLNASLLAEHLSSPLTSTLGPTATGLWGPTADAVLTWRATCNCWVQAVNFQTRPQ